MAKDYFQDITPPDPSGQNNTPSTDRPPAPPNVPAREPAEAPERSIRNIQVSSTRLRGGFGGGDIRESTVVPPPQKSVPRYWLWGGVALALLALGAIALVVTRPTSVTVVPRVHNVLFDETAIFSAYPESLAATGTLNYAIKTASFDESQTVAAEGVEKAEDKASGTITIYNNYSSETVRLIAQTRFESPDGLTYRIPAEVVVPGKRGSTPGEIRVTVFAEEVGEKYNIEPVERFTLPGLRSNAPMYQGVYARSTSAIGGGFVGERPRASASAIEAAHAEMRARLQEKVRELARSHTTSSTFAFAELARVTFEQLSPETESAGSVRINERARVDLPVFPALDLAYTVGESVAANAERGSITLRPGEEFVASARTEVSLLESGPLQFTLTGRAELVWNVDTVALAEALAGRDEGAFQAIVASFPGIVEAHARIEPFWNDQFPSDAADISVKLSEPTSSISRD